MPAAANPRAPHSSAPTSLEVAPPPWIVVAEVALASWLLALVAVCVLRTLNWPLVNDGALQHYISFLMSQGMAPYRQLLDMNLPGSLLIDWTVVHTFGPGPLAWRLFDAALMLLSSAAMLSITRSAAKADRGIPGSTGVFAGTFAASLFWLLHARDGMGQTGQRDMMESVLLLAATALLFRAVSRARPWLMVGFGLCAGTALSIKPDSVVLAALLLLLAARELRTQGVPLWPFLRSAAFGFVLPLLLLTALLAWQGDLRAFRTSLSEVTPYYASLGRRPFLELLRDCLSAPMRLFAAAALLCVLLTPRPWLWQRLALLCGVLWGLASFFLQGKGYPYHRYPALGFLLLFTALELAAAAQAHSRVSRAVACAAVLYASLVIAPQSLVRALRATWNDALLTALDTDLDRLGGPALAGHVQCIDSISGCNIALLRLQLRQQTGMLSDFLIFGPETQPAVRRTRAIFWRELQTDPPRVLVVTRWLHPSGLDDYRKLALWPAFNDLLQQRYTLVEQRSFAPGANGPLGYRIYVLR